MRTSVLLGNAKTNKPPKMIHIWGVFISRGKYSTVALYILDGNCYLREILHAEGPVRMASNTQLLNPPLRVATNNVPSRTKQ